jgi:hypothetical protein
MEVVLQAAAASGVALEINANPNRLDLDDVYARRAVELGCLLAINTDAHHPEHFNFTHFGVGVARRAWATSENVINAWPVEKLLQWLDERTQHRQRPKPTLTYAVDAPLVPPPPKVKKPAAKTKKKKATKPLVRKSISLKKRTSK